MSHPHATAPLCRFGADDEADLKDPRRAKIAVILLHGRTQTPEDMKAGIVDRLALDGLAYLAPAAAGNTWYPTRFMEPLEANQPHLDAALAKVEELSAHLVERGYPYEWQAVMGFSQGACLASEFVWRSRRRYGALICFTGGLIGPEGAGFTAPAGTFVHMPVLVGNGDADAWVPLSRSHETAEAFRAAGADVIEKVIPGRPHEIWDEEIELARGILRRLLEAGSAAR